MNKLRVILTFIHQSSIAKWMFIVRKKNKLSHAGVDFYNSYNLSYVCYQGCTHYKTVYELAGKK